MSHSLTNAVVGMNGFPVGQGDNRASVRGARVRIGTNPISFEKHKAKLTIFGIKIEMTRIISDIEIQQLLAEPKPLLPNWENRLRLKPKAQEAFSQRGLSLRLPNGHEFSLILRSNHLDPKNFSIILVFKDTDNSEYILRRHNGAHASIHTNEYEKRLNLPNAELPICFHRHLATERYQRAGLRIDGYAERTDDYRDIKTAQNAMIRDAGFVLQPQNPGTQLVLLGDD
ncbi:MAG: hypothetical protein Q7R34_11990 [Dehalococcoidia bacterium]|nr:hypothetical protein [Dehalococcoidia bacterium]